MRDVIFPLPGLAGGDDFGDTVIFSDLLNSNLYYTISIQNFMLYNFPSQRFPLQFQKLLLLVDLKFFDPDQASMAGFSRKIFPNNLKIFLQILVANISEVVLLGLPF
jgi:hypothetical protein